MLKCAGALSVAIPTDANERALKPKLIRLLLVLFCLSVLAPEEVSGYEITHLPRWKNKTLLLSNTKLIEH